jgi:hypothetical protein
MNKRNRWPRYTSDVSETDMPQCSIDYKTCFTDGNGNLLNSASEVFKHIAFRQVQCGDCGTRLCTVILHSFTYVYAVTLALTSASGNLGLEAFLPDTERAVTPSTSSENDDVPHLPLTDTWDDGAFALRDVVTGTQPTNVREWTLRLLQRYRFVIAETPSHFAMLSGPSAFNSMVVHLRRHPDTALLCVNDDVVTDDDRVRTLFKVWAKEMWGTPARWEK